MKIDISLLIAGTGLVTMGGAAAWMFLMGKDKNTPPGVEIKDGVERRHLAELSELWVEKKLTLAQASVLWIEDPKTEKKQVARPAFTNDEILDFWVDSIETRSNINTARKTAISALLWALDREGNCPSVVRNPKHADAENKYDENVFVLLAKIPLWQHSLEVAREMAKRAGTEALVADAIICGLGHDIGKIPSYHQKGYVTGDHPQISAIVLSGMSELKSLSNYSELEVAIRSHHYLSPPNPFANLLKTCDHIVRNHEIARLMHQAVEEEREQAVNTSPVPLQPQVVPTQPAIASPSPAPSYPQPESRIHVQDHPLGFKAPGKDSRHTPQRINLPWLFCDTVLDELKKHINVITQNKWGAVSQTDGRVYVNQDLLWHVLKQTVDKEVLPNLLAADAEESTKRDILYSVVWQLSEDRNAIAAETLSPDYYMISVIVTTGTNKPLPGNIMLIPFRAEAFSALASDLEALKGPNLYRMVKTIRPRQGGGSSQ